MWGWSNPQSFSHRFGRAFQQGRRRPHMPVRRLDAVFLEKLDGSAGAPAGH